MNHIAIRLLLLLISISCFASAQSDTTSKPVKEEKIKKGWTFGALPVVAYDADMGFSMDKRDGASGLYIGIGNIF